MPKILDSPRIYKLFSRLFFYFSTTHCSLLRLIVRSWVRRSIFRHQASPRVSPRESTQRRKVELWALEMSCNFA